jgi:segregation and condensation protein A
MRLELDYGLDLSEEIKPLDLLLHLVVSGKMDPWDIDIVDITDQFLGKLQEFRDLDLRLSARTILAGSVLVRLKSEAILQPEPIDLGEDEEAELREIYQILPLTPPIRRVSTKTTLPQLLEALLDALEEERYKKELVLADLDEPEERTILLDEDRIDVTESARRLYETIVGLTSEESNVFFSQILPGPDPINICRTFLYLLFLVKDRKVRIWQEEFFGRIYIQPLVMEDSP